MVPRVHRVLRRIRELPGTVTLALDGDPIPFWPGQFEMLWAFGVGEAAISVSGGGPGDGPVLHTVRTVGAISRAICALQPGDSLGVRGPFGNGWGVEEVAGADVVVVAGAIGLAPLRPAVRHILGNRDRYGRVAVLVGARSPDLLLYAREVAAWRSRFDLHVEVTVDHAGPEWRGHVGLVTELVRRAPLDPRSAVALVCGPEAMMRFTAVALIERGVDPSAIRISMERNMKCAVGHCGHCQLGPTFVCRDGPVFAWDRLAPLLAVREV